MSSRFGLPLVDVYGRMVQRPSFAEVKAAKAVLPEEEKVEKIKAQFKDTNQRNWTLQGTNISPKNGILKIPWRVLPAKTKECPLKINGWKMYFVRT